MTATVRILVLGLGGTIAMSQNQPGGHASPAAQPDASVFPIPGIELEFREIANVGSPSVTFAHVREVLRVAREGSDAGFRGVVLTHGTDTLEETAFLLNRYWNLDTPLVVTGAMRPANAPGADGPANLHDAIITAASEQARGLGVLAVFDALVHAADRVTKVSSRSIDAFDSEPSGPLALVSKDGIRAMYALEASDCVMPTVPAELPSVPLIGTGLFDRGEALGALVHQPEPPAGIVINGVGMGHVPEAVMPLVREARERGIQIVVATRIPEGGTSTYHYSYPGAEVDLINSGACMAGMLSAHKARLLLQVLLAAGASREEISGAFAGFAY